MRLTFDQQRQHKSSTTLLGCCFQACCRNLNQVGTSSISVSDSWVVFHSLHRGVCNPSLHKILLSRNLALKLPSECMGNFDTKCVASAKHQKILKVIASPQEGSRACPNKKGFTSSELSTNVSYCHAVVCTTARGPRIFHANMSEKMHVIATGEPLSQKFAS